MNFIIEMDETRRCSAWKVLDDLGYCTLQHKVCGGKLGARPSFCPLREARIPPYPAGQYEDIEGYTLWVEGN